MDFRQQIIALIAKTTKKKETEIEQQISIPPDPRLGDYAFPCFKLSKNPKEAAKKLKNKLSLPEFIAKTQVVGPYLNFFLNKTILAEDVLTKIYHERKSYGKQNLGQGKKIVIDFSSPNIAKPFGIGHLRSTVIGNCLYKTFYFLGYQPIGVNHLGDWGTQFGKLIVAYRKWGEEKGLEKDPIKYLLKLYVKFHQEAEKDDNLNEQARTEFKKLEEGNKESVHLWELFRELSLEEFKRIYQVLDVEFDSYHGEAFYNNLLDSTIKDLQQRIKTEESEGALIINLEKYKLTPVLLRKSNGSTTYHTRDLAAAFYRLKKYKPEKILYVVGMEQKLHFRQLFKVLELASIDKEKLVHIDFGLFQFPEGKMSTRKGNVIFLEEVLEKSISLVENIIEEKNPRLVNKKEVSRAVGVGAITFADLSHDRIKNIEFNWDKMLSFEGETGPYVQYTHARSCSILRKAEREFDQGVSPNVQFANLNLAEEIKVITLLSSFPEIIIKVSTTYKPHLLAQYLISLSQAFNEFYHKCPVISEMKNQMKSRLLLVDCTRQVLENSLNLLGMRAPEEM